jgi:hypothetical protein
MASPACRVLWETWLIGRSRVDASRPQTGGTGFSPDKMPLARTFAYADAHRARLGVNHKQIPVNAPKAPVHSYSKDGAMRMIPVSDPVYAPNSKGGPQADPACAAEVRWYADGEIVRTAYTLRPEDDDWSQAGVLVHEVMDDAERERLVSNVAGHLRNGVSDMSWNAPSRTGKTSTKKPATRSKPWCTDRHDAGRPIFLRLEETHVTSRCLSCRPRS